jgi:hypothetical protein
MQVAKYSNYEPPNSILVNYVYNLYNLNDEALLSV